MITEEDEKKMEMLTLQSETLLATTIVIITIKTGLRVVKKRFKHTIL